MRAVNLIPADARKDRLPSGSGAFSYLIVGILVAILAGVTALVLTNNQISDSQAEVAQLEQDRAAAQARAESLQSFADFASMQQARTETVASLAQSRFDWERVLRELSLLLPSDVWLTGLTGTVSPAVQIESGTAVSLRQGVPGPALEIVGCTVSQDSVGRFVAALRDIDGVTRVGVSRSALPDQTSAATTTSGSGGGESADDCQTRDFIARFEIVAAFDEVPVPAAAPPAAPAPAAPTGDPAAEGSTASQEAVQEGVQEGQEAANIAP